MAAFFIKTNSRNVESELNSKEEDIFSEKSTDFTVLFYYKSVI